MSVVFKDISKDLIDGIYDVLNGHVIYGGVTYPVYKQLVKNAASSFVYVGSVIQFEDGTKEQFHYYGTVQVRIVSDSPVRTGRELTQNILNVVRGLLKPAKATTFTTGTDTLVVFSHENMSEVVEQSENGKTKINLIDTYNFIIQ
jgi:hypothetical protein